MKLLKSKEKKKSIMKAKDKKIKKENWFFRKALVWKREKRNGYFISLKELYESLSREQKDIVFDYFRLINNINTDNLLGYATRYITTNKKQKNYELVIMFKNVEKEDAIKIFNFKKSEIKKFKEYLENNGD